MSSETENFNDGWDEGFRCGEISIKEDILKILIELRDKKYKNKYYYKKAISEIIEIINKIE